jgi:tetratricopeptide (TPR) repeat protein
MAWVLLAGTLVAPAGAELVNLKGGRFLQGEILEAGEQGIRVKVFDTGGVFFLPWDSLLPRDAERIRIERGLDVEDSPLVLIVPGVRVTFTNGEILEGVELEKSPKGERVFRFAGRLNPTPLKPERILKTEEIQISALDVYTADELYRKKVEEDAPDDVAGHFSMARYCTLIGAYEQAKDHFAKVQELDAAHKPDYIKRELANLDVLLANREVQEQFLRARRLRYSNKFEEARDLLHQLEGKLQGQLGEQLLKEQETLEKERTVYVIGRLVSEWPKAAKNLCWKAANDPDLKIQKAQEYALREMPKEILELLSTRLSVSAKEIKELWGKRKATGHSRAYYGSGTFIVEKIPPAKKPDPNRPGAGTGGNRPGGSGSGGSSGGRSGGGNQGGRGGNQGRNQPPRPQQEKLPTPDEWWQQAGGAERSNWLMALYVEKGKDMTVIEVTKENCPTCGGHGVRKKTTEGGISEFRCERCLGLGGDRVVKFR